MGFKFEKQDDFKSLHPNIASYMGKFVQHRLVAFDKFSDFVENENFQQIRDYCHGQLGVAGSYRCYQLEEIILYIQKYARSEEIAPIKEILPVFKDYLYSLKSKI